MSASTSVNGLVPVEFPQWEVVGCYIGASDVVGGGWLSGGTPYRTPPTGDPYRTSEAKEV